MSNKSPWSEALDKKILKWVEAKGMYEGWYDGLSHKWKHGVINQIREFFPAVIEDFQELKEFLLESPARYSEEELQQCWSEAWMSSRQKSKFPDFKSFLESLPSKARKVNVSPQAKSLLDEIDAETVEKKFCKHNGVKRIGESCMRNNKCEYPKCLVSAPVDETDYLLSTKANRERLEESINQERAKEYANEQGINYPIDTTYQSMIKSQIQSAYLAGFTASKDYAKGLLEDVSKKIIGKLNSYCLSQDNKRLGLPVLDEVAMLEMTEIVCKLLNQLK
jgi:flagellar biosynthesis/type III secretory pathway protein FliH